MTITTITSGFAAAALTMPFEGLTLPAEGGAWAGRLPRQRRDRPVPARGGASPPEAQLDLAWAMDGSSPDPRADRDAPDDGRSPGADAAPVRTRGGTRAREAATGAVGAAGTGPRSRPPGPRRPAKRPDGAPTPRAALALLRQAAEGVAEAHAVADPLLRYPAAYLSALRAGAAVLAVRASPQPKRGRARSVWALLGDVAPELGEWAAFFASCSGTRAAAEAGIARLVSTRDADDLLRQAEQFVGLVRESLVPAR